MHSQHHNRKFFLLILFVLAAIGAGRFVPFESGHILGWFRGFSLWVSGGIFVLVYVAASTVVWIGPKDVMKLVGLELFGAPVSAGLIWLAEMMNAVILFTLSRRLGEDFVHTRAPGAAKKVDAWVTRGGSWGIFLMRISIVPFRFLDLGCGLTRLPLRKYLLIAALGSPLRIFLIQYLLSLGFEVLRDPVRLGEHLSRNGWLLGMVVVYLGAAVGILVIARRRDREGGKAG